MIWEVSNWLAPTSFCKQKSMEIEWFLQLKTTHFTAEIDTLESWFLLGKNPTRTGSIDGLDHGLTWCTRGKGHVILPLLKISGKTNLNLSHQPKRDPRCREISCSLTSDCTSVQRRPPTSVHLRPFTQYFTFSTSYFYTEPQRQNSVKFATLTKPAILLQPQVSLSILYVCPWLPLVTKAAVSDKLVKTVEDKNRD